MPKHHLLCAGIFFMATQIMTVHPSYAVLGEPAASVTNDKASLGGKRVAKTTATGNRYQVHEIQSDDVSVREYVSPNGIVFAVAWNGFVQPDLDSLFGAYAFEYQHALKNTPRTPGRRSSQVTSDRVVVQKWGHMRNMQGRAYVPALLPQGVSIDEIK